MERSEIYAAQVEHEINTDLSTDDIQVLFDAFEHFIELPNSYGETDETDSDDEVCLRRSFCYSDIPNGEDAALISTINLTRWDRCVQHIEQQDIWFDIKREAADVKREFMTHYRFVIHPGGEIEAYVERIDSMSTDGGWDKQKMTRYDADELINEFMILSESIGKLEMSDQG